VIVVYFFATTSLPNAFAELTVNIEQPYKICIWHVPVFE